MRISMGLGSAFKGLGGAPPEGSGAGEVPRRG